MMDMLKDFYDLNLHLRGAVLGIVIASFLAWSWAEDMPLRFVGVIVLEATLITGFLLLVFLWLKI